MTDKNIAVPEQTQTQDTPKNTEEPDKKLAGKYSSEEELVEAYKELEAKLGKQGEEIREARVFETAVQPLLEEIRNDPELLSQIEKKFSSKEQQDSPGKAETNVAVQDEMRMSQSDLILSRFEEKYGIDKLPAEERTEMRRKIGVEVSDLTGSGMKSVDLRRLPQVLEKAYVVANNEEIIKKSKLEALASAKEADEGVISQISSSPGKNETRLTPEEAKVADSLGLTRDQYVEGKKSNS